MHAEQDEPVTGRWVSTFASDIRPGDKIRHNDTERFVIGREYPPSYQPTFRADYGDEGETLAKSAVVLIWDPDGSVAERVAALSIETIR